MEVVPDDDLMAIPCERLARFGDEQGLVGLELQNFRR